MPSFRFKWCKLSHHHHWPPLGRVGRTIVSLTRCLLCVCCTRFCLLFVYCARTSQTHARATRILCKHLYKQHTYKHEEKAYAHRPNYRQPNAILRNHLVLEHLECGLGFSGITLLCVRALIAVAFIVAHSARVGHLKVLAYTMKNPLPSTHIPVRMRADGAAAECSISNVHCACA